jgi:hypothetical protein
LHVCSFPRERVNRPFVDSLVAGAAVHVAVFYRRDPVPGGYNWATHFLGDIYTGT